MKSALAVAGTLLLSTGASAHRLDQYLQATTLSLEKDRVQAQIRLTPGIAVLPFVLASIDTDGDGVISDSEQRAYAERVLHDLSLTVDGSRLRLRFVSTRFPGMQEMKEGLGEILVDFIADLPAYGPERTLVFENHHQSRISAYLVNCLMPRDPGIRITGQNRNYEQSLYRLDYSQDTVRPGWWSGGRAWVGGVAVLLLARLAAICWRQRRTEIAVNLGNFTTSVGRNR